MTDIRTAIETELKRLELPDGGNLVSRDMVRALQRAGKDVTYIEQPEGDHHFSRDEDMVQFLLESEKFLDQHNPAD